MDHKLPVSIPLEIDLAGTAFVVIGGLFFAWLTIYRLDSLNRSWRRFGVGVGPTGARLMACMFLVGAAWNAVRLVGMVASRLP